MLEILIAEDDEGLRAVYGKRLQVAGYGVRTANTGEEVLSRVEERAPDLMLLDINMPVIDGFGILERYPKASRHFPIVVVSNFGSQANRQRGEALGADAYFVKSEMTIHKLLEIIEDLLKNKS